MKSNSLRNKIDDFIGNYKENSNKDFNKTGFLTFSEKGNNDLDDFEKKISLNKNLDFKNNLLNTSSGFNTRLNSGRKIQKTISYFNNENQEYKKFPGEFLKNDNNDIKKIKFEKIILGSTLLENHKKNMKNNLSVFKNYKPMKRYYISDLRNVPSLYQKNYNYNNNKVLNPLNPKDLLKKYDNDEFNNFKSFSQKNNDNKRFLTIW
jgi:hypothetical protein